MDYKLFCAATIQLLQFLLSKSHVILKPIHNQQSDQAKPFSQKICTQQKLECVILNSSLYVSVKALAITKSIMKIKAFINSTNSDNNAQKYQQCITNKNESKEKLT